MLKGLAVMEKEAASRLASLPLAGERLHPSARLALGDVTDIDQKVALFVTFVKRQGCTLNI